MFGDQGRVIGSITMRATMGRKRALLFAIPAVILLLVTVLIKLAHPHDASWPSEVLGIFGFTVVLPLTALIIGTSVLGAEVDEGSIVHLLATPVPRAVVIWNKYLVAVVLTAAFVAVPELLAGLIATGGLTKLAVGLFVGALAGSVMYNAVFVMVSVLTTRAIAVGLAYVLIWEGLLANFVSGAKLLSVGHYSLGVANGIAHDGNALNAGLNLGTSIVMGAIVTVIALCQGGGERGDRHRPGAGGRHREENERQGQERAAVDLTARRDDEGAADQRQQERAHGVAAPQPHGKRHDDGQQRMGPGTRKPEARREHVDSVVGGPVHDPVDEQRAHGRQCPVHPGPGTLLEPHAQRRAARLSAHPFTVTPGLSRRVMPRA